MSESIRERLVEMYSRSAQGDLMALLELAHPDARWHITPDAEKTNDLAAGRALLEALSERTNGTYSIAAHDVLVTDDHAVILEEHSCVMNGERTSGRSVAVYHLRDGLLEEAWVYSGNPEAAYHFLEHLGIIE